MRGVNKGSLDLKFDDQPTRTPCYPPISVQLSFYMIIRYFFLGDNIFHNVQYGRQVNIIIDNSPIFV